ncbi:MAG: 50S ribosomal protein L24 [Candidatus Omnitrophica bacterium]|nr:50S ribosomal protein L24 [Candidatus Omnitrophota bacterium]
MLKIKKNDIVKVLAGKDKGKSGKVITVMHSERRALVQGVNFAKKHVRKKQKEQQGGIVLKEAPVAISNLALICKRCNKATRIGMDILADGSKARFCKKCQEVL